MRMSSHAKQTGSSVSNTEVSVMFDMGMTFQAQV